uniref:Methyltransferase, YaeB family n=1 Tax=uncultured bacterium Contig1831 TaxID=1393521 RepID=W0FL40_9BACT|nr:methyltransferase, YaeB family [uncultured bacterium Contig1831]
MKIIARIRNPYDGKFGIPRQSGIVEQVVSTIVFEPEYRVAEALRGIEEFSHLWLIWAFDRAEREEWSPTVRPPRLGGNQRIGVFATRSPFRPNAVGLSCVKLLGTEKGKEGTVLKVAGADLMNGTPIYDIKPYVPYADCKPEATGGFTDRTEKRKVSVIVPDEIVRETDPAELEMLKAVLREDPRPAYQDDPERIYAFEFGGHHVEFRVENNLLHIIRLC